ncbi:MAG TPA: PAS domain-containing protein [Gaiellaceae bacterium]
MTDAFDVAQLALLGEAADCLQDVAVLVWDEDRNYVAANQAACDLIGRTRTEILSMRVGDLAADHADGVFAEVQKRGIHTGTMDSPSGRIEYVTCRTRVAGLPYMVSVCWRSH